MGETDEPEKTEETESKVEDESVKEDEAPKDAFDQMVSSEKKKEPDSFDKMLEDGNNDKKEESEVKSNSEETKPDDEPKEGSGSNKSAYDKYMEVYQQASDMNFTVYCGGIPNSSNVDESTIRDAFSPYGRILEIRYFRDKGYAFVRFVTKDDACSAIVSVNELGNA